MAGSVLLSMGFAAGCMAAAKILIHYFQLESYQFPGYFRTIRRNLMKAVLPGTILSLFCLILHVLLRLVLSIDNTFSDLLLFAALTAGGFITGQICKEKNAKKKLVYTPRIKRLYSISFLILSLFLFTIRTAVPGKGIPWGLSCVIWILFPIFLPFSIAFCGLIAWPVEKGISELYFRDAQRILKSRNDLIRIGITGSWGKTSVKFILGTMLEEKYHTLVTPASFNTPMGVTKVIRSSLEPGHRVFIAEMGARHVGDIREMCRLVHPRIGLLTSVGPQHLDTFKSVERVAKTKYELIDALPPDGMSFFSDDGDICRRLYEKTRKPKMISGLNPDKDDIWAEDIRITNDGSSFMLCTKENRLPCRTVLLGELNIRNILLCAGVCLHLGMTGEQIARGIEKIRPVDHRLQLIPNSGGLTVIDDAFNSNIRGAEQAFLVLKEMKGKRILVTPGMVELGDQEEEMNSLFGSLAAECCDLAVLIGTKRSAAIVRGLKEKGFPQDRIVVVNTLEEATALLRTQAKSGDTVLFENDLPDNYSE